MILLLDNYDSFTHNLYQYLAMLTKEEIRVVRNDAITLDGIKLLEPSRIVISPGPGRPEDAGISVAVIREFAEAVPILGVCLGHQAIGAAFGARIVSAQRIVHGKTDRIELDGRGLFRSINSPAEFVRYHSLALAGDTIPPELEISARSVDGEIMGVRHREFPIEGVQFHPESVGSEDGMKVIANFLHYRREPFEPRVYIGRVINRESLSQDEASEFMEELTEGNLTDAQIAGFLVALNAKGITAEEIAGCATVLQRKRTPLSIDMPLLDTCGTGGDGKGTFNISSLTALVAASAGAVVAKHGNRAVSSLSGSADFYRELGMTIDLTPEESSRLVKEAGFAFLFAPVYHGAMRFAGPARRQLGIKTIMNLLGPLVNPAGAQYQLIGVYSPDFLEPMAKAAVRLGIRRGMVVHGLDGLDEISVCAPTQVIRFEAPETASIEQRVSEAAFEEFVIAPENYGIRQYEPADLQGGTAVRNAAVARAIISGSLEEDYLAEEVDPGGRRVRAIRDAVILNAAAALNVYGSVQTIRDGVEMAGCALDEGKVAVTLETIVRLGREMVDQRRGDA